MRYWISLFVILTSQQLIADDSREYIDKMQEKFQTTFSNMTVTGFYPSPITGIYEVHMGGKILYFHPETDTLIFGEMYSKEGESLTAKSLLEVKNQTLSQLDVSKALVIGDTHGTPIIEFTDPDCPYCRAYHHFIESKNIPIKRVIFFDTRIHPDAKRKAVHILCSKKPEDALNLILDGREPDSYLDCEKGRALVKAQSDVSSSVGVSGTPTFILGETLVSGFQKNTIEDYLKRETTKSSVN